MPSIDINCHFVTRVTASAHYTEATEPETREISWIVVRLEGEHTVSSSITIFTPTYEWAARLAQSINEAQTEADRGQSQVASALLGAGIVEPAEDLNLPEGIQSYRFVGPEVLK